MQAIDDTVKTKFENEEPQFVNISIQDYGILTEEDIVSGSLTIDRKCSSGSSLELGSCIASELSFSLYNEDGSYDGITFEGKTITVTVGLERNGITIVNGLRMGKFICDEVPKIRGIINVTALDYMTLLDDYVSNMPETATIGQIVTYCCNTRITCMVPISGFPNYGQSVKLPSADGLTYRQLLIYALGAMGKCGYMDYNGELAIDFPTNISDKSAAIPAIAIVGDAIVGDKDTGLAYGSEPGNRYSSSYEDYCVEMTGVYYKDGDTTWLYGTKDYAYDLSNNPLIQKEEMIGALSGLVGLKYTPVEFTCTPCPYIWPMDWVSYNYSKGTKYSVVTNYTFKLNGNNGIKSVGESPTEHSRASSGIAGTIVQVSKTEILPSALDQAKAQALKLIGQSEGGYVQIMDLDGDGNPDTIYILDDKSGGKLEDAKHYWIWNQAGLMAATVSTDEETGEKKTTTAEVALTAQGGIVGNSITTGTISAERLDLTDTLKVYATNESLEAGTTTISGGCITTGSIKYDDNNYWDLTNGTFKTNNIEIGVGGTIGGAKIATVDDLTTLQWENTASGNTTNLNSSGVTYNGDSQSAIKLYNGVAENDLDKRGMTVTSTNWGEIDANAAYTTFRPAGMDFYKRTSASGASKTTYSLMACYEKSRMKISDDSLTINKILGVSEMPDDDDIEANVLYLVGDFDD